MQPNTIYKEDEQKLLILDPQQNQQLTQLNHNQQLQQNQSQQNKQIIDPIEQLVKNNNILPLIAVIDNIDMNRKIQDKPLICIMATKFISLQQVLKNKKIELVSDADRRTPLHYAIQANDVKAAAWCIKNGNPNQRDNFGNTPILDAIRLGRRRCFLLCLKNKFYDQRAPIAAAMFNKHWELKIMYGLKYDIQTVRDEQNRIAFERALQYCSFECAQFLIKINNKLNIDQYQNLTESKGLIRKLKRIQKQQSQLTRLMGICYPILIIVFILLGIYGNQVGVVKQPLPYEYTSDFYLILIVFILVLYFLMFFFDQFSKRNVIYQKKDSLQKILNQPSYKTLPQICPICVHLTDYRFNHCYKCGYCVEKFHFHSFICVHKANQVFWIIVEVFWLYLASLLLSEFHQFMVYNYISLVKFSNFSVFKIIAETKILFEEQKYLSLLWMGLLMFLLIYQAFYCLSIFVMMCLRRKYQEIIQSQKYLHLYDVVRNGDSFITKQKKILQRGVIPALARCVRNVLVYFFIDQ